MRVSTVLACRFRFYFFKNGDKLRKVVVDVICEVSCYVSFITFQIIDMSLGSLSVFRGNSYDNRCLCFLIWTVYEQESLHILDLVCNFVKHAQCFSCKGAAPRKSCRSYVQTVNN